MIPKCIDLANKGIGITINGDGDQTRDFTYVQDVVNANYLAGTTDNKEAFGKVCNIGNSNNQSVNQVVKGIIGERPIKPIHGPAVIEPKDTLADTSKAKEMINWQPEYTFDDAVKETVEWFGKQ